MTLVAGVDSSTQACKVVVRDAGSGTLVRSGRAPHPGGTEVDPQAWWTALESAISEAGGLDDVAAVAVGGQQHGMVALDGRGQVVRDALLWNDTRSAQAASDLVAELGDGDRDAGARVWADATGSVPVASFTVTKLRWLRDAEPHNAARTEAVVLPHDWLTWRLAGGHGANLESLVTDRSDVSGTGYWSPVTGDYRLDLLAMAFGKQVHLPKVLGPTSQAGVLAGGRALLAPGAGDNAAAALALGLEPGDVSVSIGTSGVVAAVSESPTADPSGLVTGFADATGRYLPLACTLNAARILDWACRLLDVDHERLAELALDAAPGAGGLVLVPYFEGERTPDRPDATAALHGIRLDNTIPQNVARAAVEGLLCSLADGIDAIRTVGVPVERAFLVGGGARSEAVRRLAPQILGVQVVVPPAGEYVADGAARQAAWLLAGGDAPPGWPDEEQPVEYGADPDAGASVRAAYADVRELTATRR